MKHVVCFLLTLLLNYGKKALLYMPLRSKTVGSAYLYVY